MNFVRHCRSLDMPLAEIKRLIELSRDARVSCEQVDALVRAHLERVQAKRKALQALEAQLSTLTAQCASGHRIADCGILEELIHAAHGEACACHPGRGER
jgi:DNA-binding transcriptional MerR regulator